MPKILLTGSTTLDIINSVPSYPVEDTEIRALQQQIRSGGNASNSAIVLAQLGMEACLLSAGADDTSADLVYSLLEAQGVNTKCCPRQANSHTPTSYISLSQDSGSRSIVHYRQLDELNAEHFLTLDKSTFDWFHFEARNCHQLKDMLQSINNLPQPVSLELEKPRDQINILPELADILFISKPFAQSEGFTDAKACLNYFSGLYPDKIITCTWGKQGAYAYDTQKIMHQAALPTTKIIESLGAGDTFNAAFIATYINKHCVEEALYFACKLAAVKCQQNGFEHLNDRLKEFIHI